MGAVTFSIPVDLARVLAAKGDLDAAVETGTYLGDSALALSGCFRDVWSVELVPHLCELAQRRFTDEPRIRVLPGYSPEVLPSILQQVRGPALFWLDGHGGTFGAGDLPASVRECPVPEEIAVIDAYPGAERSCILIDDARAFFGPMPQHRPADWPTFLEVADQLRRTTDRYVTVLDDVVIAVPHGLRGAVEDWWRGKLAERDGLESWQFTIRSLRDPAPVPALKAAARSLTPVPVRDRYTRWRSRRAAARRGPVT